MEVPSWAWWLAGALGGIAFFGAWGLWWRLPKRQVERLKFSIRDPKARADVEDNFRKTIGQLLGGAAVLLGAGLAYLQFTTQQETSRRQLEIALKQLDASLQQSKQKRESDDALLISNQVSKGFDLLASDKLAARLGGIYALEGVMNNSEQYYRPVLEALGAFVRDKTKAKTDDAPPDPDIQAALTVIGRRVKRDENHEAGTNLEHARIPRADLQYARLRFVEFKYADLRGADLSHADLSEVNLGHSNLVGAKLRFAGQSRAPIIKSFTLDSADLSEADLLYADLSEASLYDAKLISANLNGAKLVAVELRGVDLTGASLFATNLTKANLEGVIGLTQNMLEFACGTDVSGLDKLDPPLTFKERPCQD